MEKLRDKFIQKETTSLHNIVAELYESMMDRENKDAIKVIDTMMEKLRSLKADLLTKED